MDGLEQAYEDGEFFGFMFSLARGVLGSWESLTPGINRVVFFTLSTEDSAGAGLVARHCPL
jgi:hypothetical protein